MKISKHFDERPSLRVSTTFQNWLLKEKALDHSSTFCEIKSVSYNSKPLTKTLIKDNRFKK